jgi:hypothetical protein
MFGRKQKQHPPDGPFSHADDCTIAKADAGVEIPWSEFERGHFVRICQCAEEHWRAPAPARLRLDPYDPKTARHLGQCEFKDSTDAHILRILLTIKPGMSPGYQWVTCSGCEANWPVADYAEERVG